MLSCYNVTFVCSLHTSSDVAQDLTDEDESLEREQLLDEMRKHSRMATATQPINAPSIKSPEVLDTSKEDELLMSEEYV